MIKNNLLLLFFGLFGLVNAQVSESCDCTIDTIGYSSFIQTINPDESASFQFKVNGTFAVAYGGIDGNTPTKVQNLIDNYPNVTTIIMHSVPGSGDDEANLQASQLIYNHGYKMYLPQNGFVASGGTDMFFAGSIRVIEITPDAVGVHSWSEDAAGNVTATDYPVGHAKHQPYIDYYMNIGFSQSEAESFYYFTINSAPFSGVHWMTEGELDQYKVRSCRYSENPTYSISNNGTSMKADLDNKTYQWIDCETGNIIPNATNQKLTPTYNGEFAVIITETNCQDTSACMTFSYLNISENTHVTNIKLLDNKELNTTIIDLGFERKSVEYQLMDLKGSVIQKGSLENISQFEIDQPIIPGLYFIELNFNTHKTHLKWIKS